MDERDIEQSNEPVNTENDEHQHGETIEDGRSSNGEASKEISESGINRGDDQDGSGVKKELTQENSQTQSQNDQIREQMVKEYCEAALNENMTSLNAFFIKSIYPKAYAKLDASMKERAGLPVDEETIIGSLLYSPAIVLYHIFDANKLYINVGGHDNSWHYTVNGGFAKMGYTNRAKAEADAFMECFELLNK
jgi:hypothetical protein